MFSTHLTHSLESIKSYILPRVKPTTTSVSHYVAKSYTNSREYALTVVWNQFISVMLTIPEDFYDWQEMEMENDLSDNYDI